MAVIGGTAITTSPPACWAQSAIPWRRCRGAAAANAARILRQVPNLVLLALVMTLLAVTEAMAIAIGVRGARANPFGNQNWSARAVTHWLLLIVSSQRFHSTAWREHGGRRPRRWRRSAPPCC